MAGKKRLNCLKKRDLLNSNRADKSELIKLGQTYLQQGLISDCIDFFEKAEHFEELIQLKEKCADDGDYFLYRRLAKILQDPPSPEEWTHLGDKALDLGKLLFARLAFQQADNHEKAAQVEKLLQLHSQERNPVGNMLQ
ncbi:MAG: hypothetical protein LJE89_15250 [Deltaproteobacteria bacterium]|nr:hypothetical protein [Deltaproteobacteria bacterium]